MKCVLYSEELEPITVLEIQQQAYGMLARGDVYTLPVWPLEYSSFDTGPITAQISMRTVRIKGAVIRNPFKARPGERPGDINFEHAYWETLMLTTEDEESALLLRSWFLPGQTRELVEREREAWARGFIAALAALR